MDFGSKFAVVDEVNSAACNNDIDMVDVAEQLEEVERAVGSAAGIAHDSQQQRQQQLQQLPQALPQQQQKRMAAPQQQVEKKKSVGLLSRLRMPSAASFSCGGIASSTPAAVPSAIGGEAQAQSPLPRPPHQRSSFSSSNEHERNQRKVQKERSQPSKVYQRVDTNIVNVELSSLSNDAPVATGDPVICKGCKAYLSCLSAKHLNEDPVIKSCTWNCEFCGESNKLGTLHEMKKPKDIISVDYIRCDDIAAEEPPNDKTTGTTDGASVIGSGDGKGDEKAVIFCLDTSGSMCVTTTVQGKLTLRGDPLAGQVAEDLRRLGGDIDTDQRLPHQRRRDDVTYVSRMQAMIAAVDSALCDIEKNSPLKKAGLITFSSDVQIVGDGSTETKVIAGDRLHHLEQIQDMAKTCTIAQPVSQSRERLSQLLFQLNSNGSTALGPSVAAALSMLTSGSIVGGGRGSRIVLATDGMANCGIGSLDRPSGGTALYEELGSAARHAGIVIDIITIAGNNCDVESIGELANLTGGDVTIVNPLELTTNFQNMLTKKVIATDVTVRLLLHRQLQFRNVGEGTGGVGASAGTITVADHYVIKHVGNVTEESFLTFEYQVRPSNTSATALAPPAPPAHATRLTLDAKPGNGVIDGDVDAAEVLKMSSPAENTADRDANASAAPTAAAVGPAVAVAVPQQLPFQLQIEYTRANGMKCVRVISAAQETTTDRVLAERHSKISVISGHAQQVTLAWAREGNYEQSRVNMRAYNKLLTRNAVSGEDAEELHQYRTGMQALDVQLEGEQRREWRSAGGASSAVPVSQMSSPMKSAIRKSARRTNDKLAEQLYSKSGKSAKKYSESG